MTVETSRYRSPLATSSRRSFTSAHATRFFREDLEQAPAVCRKIRSRKALSFQ